MPAWLQAIPGGVELLVHAQQRASRSRVVGEHGGFLKVQLAAPPVDGEANAELIDTLAALLQVPRRQISLISGETSRRKKLRVEGVEHDDVLAVMTSGL